MRRLVLPLALIAIATGTASAEPAPPPGHPFAIAINTPMAWPWSFAASAWVGVDNHNALRANFARYRGPLWGAIPAIFDYEGEDLEEDQIPPDFGHTTDLSVGWAYYPRRVLDGANVEVGLLGRFNHLRDRIDDRNVAAEERFTQVYGARVLVGWTWRLSDWWFIALATGSSVGYERGSEKKFIGYSSTGMDITSARRVSRIDPSFEAYLRVGLAFGQ